MTDNLIKYLNYKIKYLKLKNKIIKNNIKIGGNPNNKIIAIACFKPDSKNKISGTIKFTQEINQVKIDINLSGLYKNHKHGFHIHESGDLTDNCTSMCAHFNPHKKNHGCPEKEERHVGDLGNLLSDCNGNANYIIYDNLIKLYGNEENIIGRGVIIHKDTDDCGEYSGCDENNKKLSLITGNAGDRIACAIIGYSKENFN